jgi:hypothetical protein
MNFRVPLIYKQKTRTLAHEQETISLPACQIHETVFFFCSTVKARKVETARFDFSGLIFTNDSRRLRNVASFSGGPGVEFMLIPRLSLCQISSVFPQSFRHAEVLLHTAH